MKGLYGFLHRVLAAPFRFIFNIHVVGSENEPTPEQGAYLVCSNHMTAGDPIWLCAALRHQQPHFMAKAELFRIPLLSGLLRALGAYPIERGTADVASLRNTINLLQNGKCVGMFPQGTRYNGVDPAKTSPKTGAGMIAVRSGVQVLPVFIETKGYKSSAFCRKTIHIGKPIPAQTIEQMHKDKTEFSKISGYIFGEILSLGGLSFPVTEKDE